MNNTCIQTPEHLRHPLSYYETDHDHAACQPVLFPILAAHRAASTLLRLRQEVEASHNPAELMLHVGDLSYANGDPDIWDSFLEGIDFAARLPYMVAVGNHEVGDPCVAIWQPRRIVLLICVSVTWAVQCNAHGVLTLSL
jgi:hypothetical protein